MKLKHHLYPTGEILPNYNNGCEKELHVTRDAMKGQIYERKEKFTTTDGREFSCKNGMTISTKNCRDALKQEVKKIIFHVKNFPEPKRHLTIKVSLISFLIKAKEIKEGGYEKQKIVAFNDLCKL